LINNKRIAVRTSLLTVFVAVALISSVVVISQTQDELLAKKTNGNKSGSGQSSSNSTTSSPPSSSSPSGSTGGSSTSDLNNSPGSGDPTHCDQAGYPSCYSVGYSDGLNAPGTSCPSGHSRAYCDGYKAGSILGGSSSNARKKVSTNQNSGLNLNQNGLTDSNINMTNSPFSHANTKSTINNNADVNSNLANIPLSSSHKSKFDNLSSIKQNSKVNLNQAGQTNSNINLTNSPNGSVNTKSSISNNANVKSNVVNQPSSSGSTTDSGIPSSPSTVTQNSKTTVNQGAQNNANINVNNSPGTRITNEQTIKQSVRINNEVNNIIKNNEVNNIIKQNTISAPQGPLTDIVTVKLAKSSMSSGALFPLADVEPYRVIGGHITANLPSSSQQNIVVAQISDNGQIQHAVILDLKQITGSNLDQNSLYETSLGSDISGTNPFTGNSDEVSSITNLFLWNNNQQSIVFDNANGVTMNLIYK
jgi:trimeric autotransporter adhesin